MLGFHFLFKQCVYKACIFTLGLCSALVCVEVVKPYLAEMTQKYLNWNLKLRFCLFFNFVHVVTMGEKQTHSQDIISEIGAHSLGEKLVGNKQSVPCSMFSLHFFISLQQVMLERENCGSCRPFIQKMIFPVTAATFVQNESRWPLFLPKHKVGTFRTLNVH